MTREASMERGPVDLGRSDFSPTQLEQLAQSWGQQRPNVIDVWRARGRFEASTGLPVATSSPDAFRTLRLVRTAKRWLMTGLGAAALGGLAWLMFPGTDASEREGSTLEVSAGSFEEDSLSGDSGQALARLDAARVAAVDGREGSLRADGSLAGLSGAATGTDEVGAGAFKSAPQTPGAKSRSDVIELSLDDLDRAQPPSSPVIGTPANANIRDVDQALGRAEGRSNSKSSSKKAANTKTGAGAEAATQAKERGAWERAASALRKGEPSAADSAFNELMGSSDLATRDAAELARAQLWLSQGQLISAKTSLTRLAREGSTPLIRRRAWRSLQELKK